MVEDFSRGGLLQRIEELVETYRLCLLIVFLLIVFLLGVLLRFLIFLDCGVTGPVCLVLARAEDRAAGIVDLRVSNVSGIEVSEFFVAQAAEVFRELLVEVLIDAENGGARSIAREIFVAFLLPYRECRGLAFGVRHGERNWRACQAVLGQIIRSFAGDGGRPGVGDCRQKRVDSVGVAGRAAGFRKRPGVVI